MSVTAGSIPITTPRISLRVRRYGAIFAVVAAAATSGAVLGRTTVSGTIAPAITRPVESATIPSTRPLSDASFGGPTVPEAPRTRMPAELHARQLAR
ncbi:MAG: hypothetical protein ABR518_00895 [Actinomycetota bacterium]